MSYNPPLRPTISRSKLEILRRLIHESAQLKDVLLELERKELQEQLDTIAVSYDAKYGKFAVSEHEIRFIPPRIESDESVKARQLDHYTEILYRKYKSTGFASLTQDEQLIIIEKVCKELSASQWGSEISACFNRFMAQSINKPLNTKEMIPLNVSKGDL